MSPKVLQRATDNVSRPGKTNARLFVSSNDIALICSDIAIVVRLKKLAQKLYCQKARCCCLLGNYRIKQSNHIYLVLFNNKSINLTVIVHKLISPQYLLLTYIDTCVWQKSDIG